MRKVKTELCDIDIFWRMKNKCNICNSYDLNLIVERLVAGEGTTHWYEYHFYIICANCNDYGPIVCNNSDSLDELRRTGITAKEFWSGYNNRKMICDGTR
jgi:hypothetical protein